MNQQTLQTVLNLAYPILVIIGLVLEQTHVLPLGSTNNVLIALGALHVGIMVPTPTNNDNNSGGTSTSIITKQPIQPAERTSTSG